MIIFLIGGASFDKYLPEDADSNITSGLIYGTFLEGLERKIRLGLLGINKFLNGWLSTIQVQVPRVLRLTVVRYRTGRFHSS